MKLKSADATLPGCPIEIVIQIIIIIIIIIIMSLSLLLVVVVVVIMIVIVMLEITIVTNITNNEVDERRRHPAGRSLPGQRGEIQGCS